MEVYLMIVGIAVCIASFIGSIFTDYRAEEYCMMCKRYTRWEKGHRTYKDGGIDHDSSYKYRCSVPGCGNKSRKITAAINERLPSEYRTCIICNEKTQWFKYPEPECSRCGNYAISSRAATGQSNDTVNSANPSSDSSSASAKTNQNNDTVKSAEPSSDISKVKYYCEYCRDYYFFKFKKSRTITNKSLGMRPHEDIPERFICTNCSIDEARHEITLTINQNVPYEVDYCVACEKETRWFTEFPECSVCQNKAKTKPNKSPKSDIDKSSDRDKSLEQFKEQLKYEEDFLSKLRKDKLFGQYTVVSKDKTELKIEGLWKKRENICIGKFSSIDGTCVYYGEFDYGKDRFEGRVYKTNIDEKLTTHKLDGKFIYKDNMYIMQEGEIHGLNETMKGVFENGLLTEGYVEDKDGKKLQGKFSNGQLTEGYLEVKDGARWQGKFTNGQLTEGEVDGPKMKGVVKNGQLTKGYRVDESGRKYEGKFINGELVKGRLELTDGSYIEGVIDWKKNICEGICYVSGKNLYLEGTIDYTKKKIISEKGKIRYTKKESPETETHEGVFKDQILIEGKKILFSGIVEKGAFKDGRLSKGKRIYKDGTIEEGDFTDGIHNK